MVILGKPEQRMRCVAGEKFWDDADTVDIGSHGRSYDQGLFAARKHDGAACG